MPLDARFLHWLQTADEELLYKAGELCAEAVDEAPRDGYSCDVVPHGSDTWEYAAEDD